MRIYKVSLSSGMDVLAAGINETDVTQSMEGVFPGRTIVRVELTNIDFDKWMEAYGHD